MVAESHEMTLKFLLQYPTTECVMPNSRQLHSPSGIDGDGLGRRHDGSLVTDEDEFGGVSRDQSEKHRCGHT